MTASAELLGLLVYIAVGAAALAPIVLLTLWFKDHKTGRLW